MPGREDTPSAGNSARKLKKTLVLTAVPYELATSQFSMGCRFSLILADIYTDNVWLPSPRGGLYILGVYAL